MLAIEKFDAAGLRYLNAHLSGEAFVDGLVVGFGNNPLIRGLPVFFFLVVLWFSSDRPERRGRMAIGLLATCLATILSVLVQYHFTPHIRPFLDPSLDLRVIDQTALAQKWERLGSFPSDTSTLYLALSAVIFIENRLAGTIALLWALVTVGLLRVAMGYHYPSDILAALVLGPGLVALLTGVRPLTDLARRVLGLFRQRMYLAHALLFLFLADAYNVFAGLQGISHGAQLVGHRLIGS